MPIKNNSNKNKDLVYLKIKSGSCFFGTIWMQNNLKKKMDNIKEICICKSNKVQITEEDKVKLFINK